MYFRFSTAILDIRHKMVH